MSNEEKKILLVFPSQKTNIFQKTILINLPLGILQLASYLEERGYKPLIHDTRIDTFEEFKEKAKDCLAVGFSCMTGPPIKFGLEYAAIFKDINPKAPVIFGGIHPSLYPAQTLEHPLVDFVIVGEGEETLFQMLEQLRKDQHYEDILGLGYKSNGKVIINPDRPFLDLDSLPLAAYHLINKERYPNLETNFAYQSSRGCPYRCGFCYNINFSKRRYRTKSAEKTVAEMEYLYKEYKVERFVFCDDEFFLFKDRVEKYCDLIIEKNLKFEWNASCRLDMIRKYSAEQIKKIRLSGCKSINYGAESGSEKILKLINKDITVEDILEGARHSGENGIKSFMSFMAGFPGETIEDTLETKNVIEKLWKINDMILPNTIYPYNTFPGTTLFDEAVKRGLKLPKNLVEWGDWSFQYNPNIPWITKEHNEMIKVLFAIARFKFYLRELKDRADFSQPFRYFVYIGMSPWILSGYLRWRYNFYKWSWEWDLWLFLMKRIFGFI